MQLQTYIRAIVARCAKFHFVHIPTIASRKVACSDHADGCLSVCLSVCLFVLHCITSQLCFLSFMSSLDLQQNEETLRHGSKHLYLFSVSQGKKLEHCSVQPSSFQCNFSLFKLVPLCPIPNKYCYVRKNPCHLQDLNKPLLKDYTLRNILRPLFWLFWLSLEAGDLWDDIITSWTDRATGRGTWRLCNGCALCKVENVETCTIMYRTILEIPQKKYRTSTELLCFSTLWRPQAGTWAPHFLAKTTWSTSLRPMTWRRSTGDCGEVKMVIFGRPVRVRWRCPAWTSVKKTSWFQLLVISMIVQCDSVRSNFQTNKNRSASGFTNFQCCVPVVSLSCHFHHINTGL